MELEKNTPNIFAPPGGRHLEIYYGRHFDLFSAITNGVVANLELGERWTMEGPKVPSEARRREAPERRGGEVWGGAP